MTHEEVANYNWDDGFGPIWPLVDDPATDFGTALMIYWRIDGPWLTEDLISGNRELRRMKETLEERLLGGFFNARGIRYDPIRDNQLSRVQIHKLKKARVPVELIEPK